VQKLGENAYKKELSGDMNIFVTFTDEDFTHYIEDEVKYNEDLMVNPPQGEDVDVEQTTRFDLLLQIKAMIQIGAMMTLGNWAQGLGHRRPSLFWGPLRSLSKPRKGSEIISNLK